MPDLVVIIPTRGRPHTVPELIESFRETCEANTHLTFAVDESDPVRDEYGKAVREEFYIKGSENGWVNYTPKDSTWLAAGVCFAPAVNMVDSLNKVARYVLDSVNDRPKAIAFMGDDHRPRTPGWDRMYLDALEKQPGLVYGNDLLQGQRIPTQVAMSTSVVRALDGHMAPDVLIHLYVDDYWKNLGVAAHCLTYLPDVIIEHMHPEAGKAQWDEGYRRVNDVSVYAKDAEAYLEYWNMYGDRDTRLVIEAISRETR